MKILKYIFFLLLIVVIGGAIYFGTKDGKYDFAEERIMNIPASLLYNNVNNYKTWPSWSPWLEKDPDTKRTYSDKTSGEGANFTWDSENMEVGKGTMETIAVIPNKRIKQQITFSSPIGDSKSDVQWDFKPTDTPGQTKVIWGMKGEQSLLEKVFMSFMEGDLETMVRRDYQKGLAKLETTTIATMQKYTITVENNITQYGGGYYMYASTSCNTQDVGVKMRELMSLVVNYMKTNNIDMAGYPFSIYNQVDETTGTVIFSAAVPVKENIITPSGSPVIAGFMKPVSAVKTILKGNYINLSQAYTKANAFVAKNNYTLHPTANMFEVYPTDPELVPNPANWITEIYLPIVSPSL
ncbi:MAG: effector-binding domain-containing protein/uncharacterized protein YndB with AHSA1/START domain [Patiriisocius sp.]|jgi:effector-binding domain-containing protein/uncharacterized protein YndB with AHSA1/START domain